MKRILTSVIAGLLLVAAILSAQTTKEEFFSSINYAGGLYCPYSYDHAAVTPTPQGYAPFYISHYGRHGSRWLLYQGDHVIPMKILAAADSAGMLTPLGRILLQRMTIIARDAENRLGDLAPLGVREQRGIAECMMRNYPGVFSTENGRACVIHSRSTQVPRCILSMAAFNERLKELNPAIETMRESTRRDAYMYADWKTKRDTINYIVTKFLTQHLNPARLMASIFSDTAYARSHVNDPVALAVHLYGAAVNMLNIDYLRISIMDIFTQDELFILWQAASMRMYYEVGPSPINGGIVAKSIAPLLQNILECADAAIANNNVSADLRFGHDSYIIPLLAIMDVEGMNAVESNPEDLYKKWSDFKISPMGTNLQMIFYRNQKSGDILVKFLHCEKEMRIPVPTDVAPFYHWNDVRTYYVKKLAEN